MTTGQEKIADEKPKPDRVREALKAQDKTLKREQAGRLGDLEQRFAKIRNAPIER